MFETIAVFAALILLNGYFSAIEAAFLALNVNKIKMLADDGDEKYVVLKGFLENGTKNLAVIQIGITFSALLACSIGAIEFFVPLRTFFAEKLNFIKYGSSAASILIIVVVVTYIALVIGNFIPKRLGIKYSESISFSSIKVIKLLGIIISPIVFLATIVSNGFIRLLGINPSDLDANITEEEIRLMVDAGGDSGSIDESEMEMINNIFEFDNTSAGDIATHRTDILAVPVTASLEDIIKVVNEGNFSRIPVYDENIDDIIGIFHIKEILKFALNNDSPKADFDLRSILMKPYFVPFSKKTDELFEEMQKNKVHMAIIIDEYGGTAGIVTMEDLLEEIVGKIFDEYDDEEDEDIQMIDENTFSIKGTASLEDVEEVLDMEFDDEDDDYDTIGGYIIGQLGRIPDEDEEVSIDLGSYRFTVENIEEKRIETIFAKKL